ncbi:MBOAT family protein [Myxococcota bacterium]|nr:MBOAT family protein [Myxococcota bacterium]
MRFNSVVYWAFLALVVVVTWALPSRARRWWLLGTSYFFYGSWHYPYLALLFGVAALNHFGAVWICGAEKRDRRGAVVIAANLGLLASFKYLDWGASNVNALAALLGVPFEVPLPRWVLPLGISFYVFESMSYIIDVIRKRERVHGFWELQLFIAFFPKLIAGPILRAKELLPQVEGELVLRWDRVRSGIWLVASGLFIKIVLADGLVQSVDGAFTKAPASLGALDVVVMAIGFGMQIYFDFCGYSRIALGSAALCGIDLVENFNHPYVARSPADFWNRWHISLSRWIRDYLFYPLVGKKPTLVAMCRAAILSMTLCGVWHGAGWSFVAWGLYHGLLIAGYHVVKAWNPKAARPGRGAKGLGARSVELAGIALTFGLVSIGWIFFRSESLAQAFGLIANVFTPADWAVRSLGGTFYLHVVLLTVAVWSAPALSTVMARIGAALDARPTFGRWGYPALQGVIVGALMVLCLTYLRGKTAFIYFQF